MAKVLVVDDDPGVAAVIGKYLRIRGHEVDVVGSGREALGRLAGMDLVITDVQMPEMSGIELILAIRKENSDVAVIAMSGTGPVEETVKLDVARALGVSASLTKPFPLSVLRAAVDRAVGGADEAGRSADD